MIEDIVAGVVHPLSDLSHFLYLPQISVHLFQLAFHVASLGDVPILAEHHVIVRIHDTLEIIGIILQFQLVVLADASLFPKHGLEGAVNLLTGVFGHPFEYIFS